MLRIRIQPESSESDACSKSETPAGKRDMEVDSLWQDLRNQASLNRAHKKGCGPFVN